MISQFNQPRGSTSIEVNKQSIARNFGVKEDEVIYFTVGIDLSGFKVIYDESTQRAYSLPSGIVSGTIAISLNEQAILTHSAGSVDLGELAVSREEYVTLPGSFNFGHTINVKNELIVHDDKRYRWDGSLPKVVDAGVDPASTVRDYAKQIPMLTQDQVFSVVYGDGGNGVNHPNNNGEKAIYDAACKEFAGSLFKSTINTQILTLKSGMTGSITVSNRNGVNILTIVNMGGGSNII